MRCEGKRGLGFFIEYRCSLTTQPNGRTDLSGLNCFGNLALDWVPQRAARFLQPEFNEVGASCCEGDAGPADRSS